MSEATPIIRPIIRMDAVHKTYALDGVEVHALRGIALVVVDVA